MNTIDVKKATNAELVKAYNKLTGKNIKKFSSRANGEKQVTQALRTMNRAGSAVAPAPVAPKKAEEHAPVDEAKATTGRKIAAAVAATWKDAEVREKRIARHNVEVDGTVYRSVRDAFRVLGLPDSKHIKFRAQLKAAKEMEFSGHSFKIVEPTEAHV